VTAGRNCPHYDATQILRPQCEWHRPFEKKRLNTGKRGSGSVFSCSFFRIRVRKALVSSIFNIVKLKVRKTYFKLNSFAEIYEKEKRKVVRIGTNTD
jgi:hypothetical protein